MSNLITDKEALIALLSGKEVQMLYDEENWGAVENWTNWKVIEFLKADSDYKFRLKPRTIPLNGVEVPAPFEPKDCDTVFLLSNLLPQGYMECKYPTFENHVFQFGAWRTEDEIKQVVVALRKVFGDVIV